MLSDTVLTALNDQIKSELDSSYLYFSMSAYFESESLTGFAHWMRVQAHEEFGHVMKYYNFIHERGGRVTLQVLDQPSSDFASPRDVFEKTLAHEQSVSAEIRRLYELVSSEKDYASGIFVEWFIKEQVEEESSVQRIIDLLERAGDSGPALLALDQQLGNREVED